MGAGAKHMNSFSLKKYILVFIITATIFTFAFGISNYLNGKKVDAIRATENSIAINILSLETQFDLLQDSSCKKIGTNILSDELNVLADRLAHAEEQKGIANNDVIMLKKHYSLLQMKDYLLMKKVSEKCDLKPISILYFYSNADTCTDCRRQGYVLTTVRENNPDIRVYSFDTGLELNALSTLTSLYEITSDSLPAIVVNDKMHKGYQSLDSLYTIIPELATTTANTATSTPTQK